MRLSSILPRSWYDRDVVTVARDMLGMRLVRLVDGQRLAGIITEAEAYRGEEDLACHAHVGRTPRTETLYGPPGRAYVYFTYGMHWMLNAVCCQTGYPAAVLIRALMPLEGINTIAANRGNAPRAQWTNGPAKITQAFKIGREQNGADLTSENDSVWIEEGITIPNKWVTTGPRVGIRTVPEPWKSVAWRFLARLPEEIRP